MKNQISEKQLVANRENAKKGGVKTNEGKEISKFNALTHGILSNVITEYDSNDYQNIQERLLKEFEPSSFLTEFLVERIVLYIIRLNRVASAETEYMKTALDPTKGHMEEREVKKERKDDIFDMQAYEPSLPRTESEWVVDRQGYSARLHKEDIETLQNIYLRYEKSIENRLYGTIKELERMQNKCENLSNNDTPKKDGFVSQKNKTF